jgi:hypothetical protein
MPTLRFCPIWLCSLGLVALLQGCSVWGSRTETDTPRRQQLRRELRLKRLLSRFEVLPERWQLVVSDSSFRRDISGRFYCGDRQLMPVDNRLISPCLNLEGLRNSRGIIPTQFYALGQVPVRAGPKPLLMVTHRTPPQPASTGRAGPFAQPHRARSGAPGAGLRPVAMYPATHRHFRPGAQPVVCVCTRTDGRLAGVAHGGTLVEAFRKLQNQYPSCTPGRWSCSQLSQ